MWKNHNYMDAATDGTDGAAGGGEVVIDTADAGADKAVVNTTDKPVEYDAGVVWEKIRGEVAGEDKSVAKRLARYATMKDAMFGLIAAQNKISSGELKSALPEKASPEEIAQYRKDNGIPETADKYDLGDYKVADEDRPVIESILKTVHDKNFTPSQAKTAVEIYHQEVNRMADERQAKDEAEKTAATDALNVEYGKDFRKNMNAVSALLSKFPASVRESLAGGRLADGTGIFNSPDVVKGFVALARELDPAGTLVPGGDGNAMKGVEDEITQIEGVMSSNRTKYNKDEKMQARYRELLDIREKMKK